MALGDKLIFPLSNADVNVPEHQVNLFFSVDLVNATKFKSNNKKKWVSIFADFYDFVVTAVQKKYRSDAEVWKLGGDEILFCVDIRNMEDILRAPSELYSAMNSAQGALFDRHRVAKNNLYFQGALWIAATTDGDCNKEKNSPRNVRGKFLKNSKISEDFLGVDIDEGFRVAANTSQGKIAIDPKIAYLLNEENELNRIKVTGDIKIEEKIRIVTYKILKGIWNERPFPIIWYAPNWDVNELFLYDELHTSELAKAYMLSNEDSRKLSNIKTVFEKLKFPLVTVKLIESILENLKINNMDSLKPKKTTR